LVLEQAEMPRLDPAAVAAARVTREEFHHSAGIRRAAP
jgi:hypothetical protein